MRCLINKELRDLVPGRIQMCIRDSFQTFRDRLKGLPCRVEYLSRARTAAQSKAVLKGLKEGDVNILIGTHRILGKDVQFKDLGLLIVDEEQKFGVSVKEKLRQLKVNVDTLTMTATPIPRTLQFSLMGARDLSVISTPPPNRYPIQTEVHLSLIHIFPDIAFNAPPSFSLSRCGAWSVAMASIKPLLTASCRAFRSFAVLMAGLHLMRAPSVR